MPAPDLTDPFHRALYKRLIEELEARTQAIAGGSASVRTDDTRGVAEKYAAQVSYILALREVLGICEELELEFHGVRPQREDED